jgi:hypothetical protein
MQTFEFNTNGKHVLIAGVCRMIISHEICSILTLISLSLIQGGPDLFILYDSNLHVGVNKI